MPKIRRSNSWCKYLIQKILNSINRGKHRFCNGIISLISHKHVVICPDTRYFQGNFRVQIWIGVGVSHYNLGRNDLLKHISSICSLYSFHLSILCNRNLFTVFNIIILAYLLLHQLLDFIHAH